MSARENPDEPLKLAILVQEGRAFESWEIALFERLAANPSVTLEAFLCAPPPVEESRPSAAYRLVSAIDRKLFGRTGNAPFEAVMDGFDHIPAIGLSELQHGSQQFDVVLSHLPTACDHQFAAQLWEYHFNLGTCASAGAFGFREALESSPVTRTAVLRLDSDGSHSIVCQCISGTKFSAAFNAAYAKGMLPSLVERELVRSARNKAGQTLEEGGDRFGQSAIAPASVRTPTFGETALYAAKLAARVTRRLVVDDVLRRLGAQPGNWSLLLSEGDILESPLDRLTELKQPKDEFRADPFLFERGGEKYVFFEACDRKSGVGRIAVGRIVGDRIEEVQSLDLGQAHHSYPFVFEHGGEAYMIPETHQRDRVEVWRCTQFPGEWTLHATALEGQSPADTVFVEWNGECWLFTNLGSGSFHDHCAELHLFRIDGPDLRSVEQHPLNPVVVDTTSARNGGRPFVHDGRLIRPAQITSHGLYGYGLKLLEVTSLSMRDYAEREVRRIEPRFDQSTTGCHHLDLAPGMFIMDARRAFGSKLMGARPIAVRAS